jgi:hypothetical protein
MVWSVIATTCNFEWDKRTIGLRLIRMRHWLWLILPLIIAACGPASTSPTAAQTDMNSHEYTQPPAFSATELFVLTAESEPAPAGYTQEAATITAITAGKSTPGTATAVTISPQPSETPLPTVPASAPFCQPADLQKYFGTSGASQQVLVSAGLQNKGTRACFLQVWPQVRLEDKQGRALDVDYGYFDIGFSLPGAAATERAQKYATARVGLWPGWSIWINLLWQNWCAAPVAGGTVIRLTFNNTGVINITTDVTGGGTCSAQGQRSYVGISKLVLRPSP